LLHVHRHARIIESASTNHLVMLSEAVKARSDSPRSRSIPTATTPVTTSEMIAASPRHSIFSRNHAHEIRMYKIASKAAKFPML
jgi:hypothetical protein